jgi:hypothetical protein
VERKGLRPEGRRGLCFESLSFKIDEYNPNWTFEGGMQDLELLFLIGKNLHLKAAGRHGTGSEFKAIRER